MMRTRSLFTRLDNLFSYKNAEQLRQTILRKSAITLILKIAVMGLSLISGIVLARFLGLENYGTYVYVYAWVALLALPAKLGFSTGAVRIVSTLRAEQRWPELKGFVRGVPVIISITGAAVGGLLATVTWIIRDSIDNQLAWTLYSASLLLPLISVVGLYEGILRGMKHVFLMQLPKLTQLLAVIVIITTLSSLTSTTISSVDMMAVQIAIYSVILVLCIYLVSRMRLEPEKLATSKFKFGEWIRLSMPMLFVSSMLMIMKRVDVLMLGYFTTTADAGIYAVASRLSDLTLISLASVNSIVAPTISELFSKGQLNELQKSILFASRLTLGILLLIVAMLVLGSSFLLELFGSEFLAAKITLFVLLVGRVISALVGPVGYLLTMTGHQTQAAIIVFICAVCNVALNSLLIPTYGIEGAAVATTVSITLWNILLWFQVYKSLRIRSGVF